MKINILQPEIEKIALRSCKKGDFFRFETPLGFEKDNVYLFLNRTRVETGPHQSVYTFEVAVFSEALTIPLFRVFDNVNTERSVKILEMRTITFQEIVFDSVEGDSEI